MTDDAPLPPVHVAIVDEATARALFATWAALPLAPAITLRTRAAAMVAPGRVAPDAALRALLDRSAVGAQIRYVHDDDTWTDTILVTPHGFRIVRMRDADVGVDSARPVPAAVDGDPVTA